MARLRGVASSEALFFQGRFEVMESLGLSGMAAAQALGLIEARRNGKQSYGSGLLQPE
jgi:hypothetical protein